MAKSEKDQDMKPAAERREEAAAARDPDLTVGAMGTASGTPGQGTAGMPDESPANAPRETRPAVAVNEEDEPERIWVMATNNEGRIAIWEKDVAHPGGEAFVSGDGIPHEVADTAAMRVAIREGRLKEVSASRGKAMLKEYHGAREERRRAAVAAMREQAGLDMLQGAVTGAAPVPARER